MTEQPKDGGAAFDLAQMIADREADEVLRQAIGRGWCHEENVAKEMDVDLAEAIFWEIRAALSTHTEEPKT